MLRMRTGGYAEGFLFAESSRVSVRFTRINACYMCMSRTAQIAHQCIAAVGECSPLLLQNPLRKQQSMCRLCSVCGDAAIGDMLVV